MKSALECIQNAERCEQMAARSRDERDRGNLLATAAQWRNLAGGTAAHSRMVELGDKPLPDAG